MYVGQSINIKRRLRTHKRASNTKKKGECFYVHNAISKYGQENFKFEVLLYSNNKEYLNIMEQKCIQSFNTLSPNGYNLDTGGYFNRTISEATREKYDLILQDAVWIAPKHDITDKVIKAINTNAK